MNFVAPGILVRVDMLAIGFRCRPGPLPDLSLLNHMVEVAGGSVGIIIELDRWSPHDLMARVWWPATGMLWMRHYTFREVKQ